MDWKHQKLLTGKLEKLQSFLSDNVPVYFFIHLKGQLMQFALRNEIQEKISVRNTPSDFKGPAIESTINN